MTQVVCPDRETLELLLLDRFSGPQAEELAEHLLGCEDCLTVAETIADGDDFTAVIRASQPLNSDEDTDPALAAGIERA